MTRCFACWLLIAGGVLPAFAQQPGAPIDVQHYAFHLALSDTSNQITGAAGVTVRFLRDDVQAFALDFVGQAAPSSETGMTVAAVMLDSTDVPFEHMDDRLTIHLSTPPEAGTHRTYTIRYAGVPADGLIIAENKYGERTFFGDNWPDRARHWLPTVDHPSDKATAEFVVVAPDRYQVVGSGALVEETNLPEDLRLTHWRTTAPLSTKVMVIGAARFAVDHLDEIDGVPVQSWVYPQDRARGFYDFARAERILHFFDDHIGPFPYEKLANVQSKTRYGGMENASNIFYSETAVTGTRANEGLQAHEIAHQWFGDSVTEVDWPHLWLSEGFATYFTQLYMEFTYGRDRMNAGMRTNRDQIIAFSHQNPDDPVVDSTFTHPTELLNANSYQKGGWVLHMLRYAVGDEAFWDGIQAYYRQYRDGNASTGDFRRVMEAASGQDLDVFFRQWLHQPGQPRLEGTWRYDAGAGHLVVTLRQTQREDWFFHVPLELGIYTDDATLPRIEVVDVDERTETFMIPLDAPPADVVLDPNVWLLMEAGFRAE